MCNNGAKRKRRRQVKEEAPCRRGSSPLGLWTSIGGGVFIQIHQGGIDHIRQLLVGGSLQLDKGPAEVGYGVQYSGLVGGRCLDFHIFYKLVVKVIILFALETWFMTYRIGKTLGGLHHRVHHRLVRFNLSAIRRGGGST